MDDRKQLRIWQWATILLLLCNAALIILVWFAPPRGGGEGERNNRPRDLLIKEVGFSDAQAKQYEELITAHRDAMQRLRREGRDLRDQLFAQLGKPAASPDSLYVRIGINQQQIEQTTYQHFEQVRKLCTDAQKEQFDRIIGEVLRTMNRNKPPHPGPDNDHGGRPPHNEGDNERPDGPPPGDRRPPPDRN